MSPVKPLEPVETFEKRTSRRESSLRVEIPDDQPQKNLFFKKTEPVTKSTAVKQGPGASSSTSLLGAGARAKKERRGKQTRSPQVVPAPAIPSFIHEPKPKIEQIKPKIETENEDNVEVSITKLPYEKLNKDINSRSPFDVHHESPRASYCVGE